MNLRYRIIITIIEIKVEINQEISPCLEYLFLKAIETDHLTSKVPPVPCPSGFADS